MQVNILFDRFGAHFRCVLCRAEFRLEGQKLIHPMVSGPLWKRERNCPNRGRVCKNPFRGVELAEDGAERTSP